MSSSKQDGIVAAKGLDSAEDPDIFRPYERLIEITIRGAAFKVPENNTILRCLQFLELQRISDAELCWNGNCQNCTVRIIENGRARTAMSCRTEAVQGMAIEDINPAIDI
ncbi:MAG: (2Fe-2S)-binding protein [Acidobacteria bacterium]|nr:(2Fe-2S)-binding protein [Acidobacteriota bacterium]